MTLILAYRNRGLSRDLEILKADGNPLIPGPNDRVRVMIGREGETPKLTVESGTPTANGSSLAAGATNRLRLDASDLAFEAGTYTFFFDYYDNADAQEWKNVEREVFQLEET